MVSGGFPSVTRGHCGTVTLIVRVGGGSGPAWPDGTCLEYLGVFTVVTHERKSRCLRSLDPSMRALDERLDFSTTGVDRGRLHDIFIHLFLFLE